MNSKHLQVNIADVANQLFAGKAVSLTVPGSKGQMQILPNHEPLISTLKKGEVVVEDTDAQKHKFEIKGGLLEVANNSATVLVAEQF